MVLIKSFKYTTLNTYNKLSHCYIFIFLIFYNLLHCVTKSIFTKYFPSMVVLIIAHLNNVKSKNKTQAA